MMFRSTLRQACSRGRNLSYSARSQTQKTTSASAYVLGATAAAAFTYYAAQNNRAEAFWGGSSKPAEAAKSAPVDYNRLKDDIKAAITADEEKRGDGTSMGPTLVRLAWHAAGTYSIFDKTGGSNYASMRFAPEKNWGANAGLQIARDFLEPMKKKYPGVSYGDLWTLAGATAIEAMGGPVVPWRSGRQDLEEKSINPLPDGRLPNANMGCPHATNAHIRDIFGRMGFNDRETVALIGAHAVGRCHTDASGFWGPWTNAETTFSNEYFRLLVEEKWTQKKTHQGKAWTGPMQYEDKTGNLMMLPADLWLVEDKAFKTYVDLYAKDENAFFQDFAAAFSKLLELGVKF